MKTPIVVIGLLALGAAAYIKRSLDKAPFVKDTPKATAPAPQSAEDWVSSLMAVLDQAALLCQEHNAPCLFAVQTEINTEPDGEGLAHEAQVLARGLYSPASAPSLKLAQYIVFNNADYAPQPDEFSSETSQYEDLGNPNEPLSVALQSLTNNPNAPAA